MNPELPPLPLSQPIIRARRREKPPFIQLPSVSIVARTDKCRILRQEIAQITNVARQLSPEQRRAIFLKLRHDRPLTKLDLKGTGLVLMAPSAEKESLVVSRKENLAKLDKRLEEFAADQESDRPKSTEFVTGVTSISIADPKDRLSPDLASEYTRLVTEEFVIFEIEVASFAMQSSTRSREVKATLEELRQFLGAVDGRIYETDFAGSGARAVLSSTGAKLRALVDDPRWWRRIVFFDKRPQFQTFQNVYQNFNISNSTITAPPEDAETICIIDTGVAAANPFLEKVLRADISRSFVDGFAPDADPVGHGSGVASLAAYYQIDMTAGGSNTASAFVVSARITNDNGELDTIYTDDDGVHRVRQARLLSNILKDVVQHFRPLGVRVFVLSFNIVGHIWSQATQQLVPRNSWVARTIDQLSKEHDVIFVAITGNITPSDLTDLIQERAYPNYLVQPLAKLLDPGQAALAATGPAVQTWGVAEYLAAQLKFRLFRGDKSVEDIVAMMQREDGDENLASQTRVDDLPGKLRVRRRSVGTLQRDVFEWNDHEEAFSADDYILGVSLAAASWCKSDPPNVPIGIAIRIEDTSGICQQLYARVRARVQEQARAHA